MEFRILGALEAVHEGEVVPLGGARRHALLASLLLRANDVVSVGHLAESIWERPPASMRSNVRTHIAGLRRTLAPAGVRLTTEPSGYRLSIENHNLDLHRFERTATRGTELMDRGEFEAAADLLGTALRIWRGTPFEGQPLGPLLQAEAVRLEERRLAVAEKWLTAQRACGAHGDAVGELRRLVIAHPFRESLWLHLMTSLHEAGRTAEALRAYHEARSLLQNQLGIDPCLDLQGAHQQILHGRAAVLPLNRHSESRPAPVP
ncbi:BTAD domain-containing putative transcriptional regulator [Planomonospora corallina]|uniref:BTAD domain-containing putative transcriptional regulator n=1 Tax=Planomonospora corallina TaxID=1806052 RepID=A0ABV8I6Z8_9ACTN